MASVGSGRSGKSGVVVVRWGSIWVVMGLCVVGFDDYSWWWVKELEFGVGYKRLRWGWLSGGVKFVRWLG